jgi:thiamine-monophosphate kinase
VALTGEDRLIGWLRARLGPGALPGDDAALLPEGAYAATVDSQIEGVHFPVGLDPAVVARRLLAVNLSDLAAMGADPAFGLLALAAPSGFDHRRFFRAFTGACRAHRVELAGGDLATSHGPLVATLTLLGTHPAGSRWLRRDGARAGHALWLGGPVGNSAAGQRLAAAGGRRDARRRTTLPHGWDLHAKTLQEAARQALRRHLLPEPQLALGAWLRRQPEGGAIDVSDGLARDLHRLCRESGTGARIDHAALPLPRPDLCRELSVSPDELALAGGEDYVLLFTLPEGIAVPPVFGSRRIGRMTGGKAVLLERQGRAAPLSDRGFDHLAGSKA